MSDEQHEKHFAWKADGPVQGSLDWSFWLGGCLAWHEDVAGCFAEEWNLMQCVIGECDCCDTGQQEVFAGEVCYR